jgi:hydrogenase large subunit
MVPGGVMCAPTLTDVTRAWSILEYFRSNWIEPVWLGCSLERYEDIKTYEEFMAWLDEKQEHQNSDLGLMWRMGSDIGLDRYGAGIGKYMSWGYLPHEEKYQKPTIAGRNEAVIMPSGVYDGANDAHRLMEQERTLEDISHAWYEESDAPKHPFQRTTVPATKNALDFSNRYSWATAVLHADFGHLEAGPLARQLVVGGSHMLGWQYKDGLLLDMYRKLGGASVLLRHFARMHEFKAVYRQIERCLRELKLNEPFYLKPKEIDGQGWGATEAARGALCHWIDIKAGKIKNYQIVAPTTWNVGPRTSGGQRGPIEEALVGTPIADRKDPVEVGHVARSYDSCLVCTVHAYDARTHEELARFRTA